MKTYEEFQEMFDGASHGYLIASPPFPPIPQLFMQIQGQLSF